MMSSVRFAFLKIVAAASVGIAASVLPARALVYNVNETIGAGSVIGTVTTNGTFGTNLGPDIFTAWDLHLNGDGVSFEIKNTDTGAVVWGGGDITATPNYLMFNYSAGDGGFLLFQDGLHSGTFYWCLNTSNAACVNNESVVPQAYTDPSAQFASRSGDLVFATAVPEPSTWAMMILGCCGVGFLRYRRRNDLRGSAA